MRRLAAALLLAAWASLALAAPAAAREGGWLAGLLFFRSPLLPPLAAGPATVRTWAFTDAGGSADFTLLGALGIMRGDSGPDGPVHPEAPVTRAELAVVVVRLLGQEGTLVENRKRLASGERHFADEEEIPAWARPYALVAAVDLGLMPRGGRFGAGEPVTRDEAAAVLLEALEWWSDGGRGRDWPAEAREEARRRLLARLEDRPAGAPLTRGELAVMAVNALRAGRYDPNTGLLDPEGSILLGNFLVGRGFSPQPEGGYTQVRLYRCRECSVSDRYDLAPRVFLVGARSLDDEGLKGRPALALRALGGDGRVACLLVAP